MKSILSFVLASLVALLPQGAAAQDAAQNGASATQGDAAAAGAQASPEAGLIRKAGDSDLKDFQWVNRPLVVFADSDRDPRFRQQMEYLRERQDALIARDVVVLTDTDPSARGPIREQLRPRGFMLVLVGKDGAIYMRKPSPRPAREIVNLIDNLPERQREQSEQNATGGGS